MLACKESAEPASAIIPTCKAAAGERNVTRKASFWKPVHTFVLHPWTFAFVLYIEVAVGATSSFSLGEIQWTSTATELMFDRMLPGAFSSWANAMQFPF